MSIPGTLSITSIQEISKRRICELDWSMYSFMRGTKQSISKNCTSVTISFNNLSRRNAAYKSKRNNEITSMVCNKGYIFHFYIYIGIQFAQSNEDFVDKSQNVSTRSFNNVVQRFTGIKANTGIIVINAV